MFFVSLSFGRHVPCLIMNQMIIGSQSKNYIAIIKIDASCGKLVCLGFLYNLYLKPLDDNSGKGL